MINCIEGIVEKKGGGGGSGKSRKVYQPSSVFRFSLALCVSALNQHFYT